MRLAASNIGWRPEADEAVLRYLQEEGFEGLEIAPTRVFPAEPYSDLKRAGRWAEKIRKEYGLEICSMQSIWFGKTERIAESEEARKVLLDYTEQAIHFADVIECRNIVFGCPRNRTLMPSENTGIAEEFLWNCAEIARPYGVVIALEPNPAIYHTNYLNTTKEVLELLERKNHPSLMLNLDMGTVIENRERMDWIPDWGRAVHHVHISEPMLAFPRERTEHNDCARLLKKIDYRGFVSLEMGTQEEENKVFGALAYLKRQFA